MHEAIFLEVVEAQDVVELVVIAWPVSWNSCENWSCFWWSVTSWIDSGRPSRSTPTFQSMPRTAVIDLKPIASEKS